MSSYEVFECDECSATNKDEPGAGWGQNVDGDDFCADCLRKHPLDPPETAAEVRRLRRALQEQRP